MCAEVLNEKLEKYIEKDINVTSKDIKLIEEKTKNLSESELRKKKKT